MPAIFSGSGSPSFYPELALMKRTLSVKVADEVAAGVSKLRI